MVQRKVLYNSAFFAFYKYLFFGLRSPITQMTIQSINNNKNRSAVNIINYNNTNEIGVCAQRNV